MSTVRIQVRRGTASQWTSVNPILAAGEMGVESDSNLFKFGNGSSTWTALAYANNSDVAIGEISQDAVNQALAVGAGLTKTYNDGANTITVAVDDSYFNELAQDAVNSAIQAGTGITRVYNDSNNTITFSADEAVLATRTYVNNLNTTLQNTADSTYLLAADLGTAGGPASLNSSGKVPANQLDITNTVKTIASTTIVGGRGSNVTHDVEAGTLTLSAPITGTGSVTIANNAGDNGMTVGLTPIVDATTKLRTPLVETTAVNTSTLDAATGTIGALTISGNLTVNGTSTTVNSTNVSIDDPMLYLGDGNQSNVLDLGVVAAFNNGTYQHAGLVRDASDATWKLFSGVTAEPGTTVDFTTYTKDSLELGNLFADAAVIGDVSNAELQRLHGVSSPIQAQIDAKLATTTAATTYAPLASPTLSDVTLTGTITAPYHTLNGAVIQDGTITNQQISASAAIAQSKITGLTEAIAERAKIEGPTFTGMVTLPATTSIGSVSATEIGYLDSATSNIQAQINGVVATVSSDYTTLSGLITAEASARSAAISTINTANGTQDVAIATKSPIESPTFTGTVTVPTLAVTGSASGITKTMVGLANVDNTADADKPVSSAAQTALDAKLAVATAASTYAPIASPTFTGTVSGVTKAHVGLENVDNTADASKPVSTAQATAIATAKSEAIADATSQVNALLAGAPAALNTLDELAAALGDDANFASTITTSISAKAPLASPTFTGTVTVGAAGIVFSDGTQTRAGVPSITTIGTARSASETLAAGEQDKFVPVSGAVVITLPATGYSTGQSIDFWQQTGTGASFAATNGVVGTPGLKFRTTNSVVTALKISSGWLVFGDLSA
jgi:hypothetical protein